MRRYYTSPSGFAIGGKAQDSHTLSHGDPGSFGTRCLLLSQTIACPFAFVTCELHLRFQNSWCLSSQVVCRDDDRLAAAHTQRFHSLQRICVQAY
jgi:hypothetical protein